MVSGGIVSFAEVVLEITFLVIGLCGLIICYAQIAPRV